MFFLFAHIAFNTGIYSGYVKNTRTVTQFVPPYHSKLFNISKGDSEISQQQWYNTGFIGIAWVIKKFQFGVNGFLGTSLLNDRTFKNALSFGAELSVLYAINRFTIGAFGGIEWSAFRSKRYAVEFPKGENALIHDNDTLAFYHGGFLGLKCAWKAISNWTIAVKGQYLFDTSKDLTHEKWHFEKSIVNTISEKTELGIHFKSYDTYGIYRVLAGVEYSLFKGDRYAFI